MTGDFDCKKAGIACVSKYLAANTLEHYANSRRSNEAGAILYVTQKPAMINLPNVETLIVVLEHIQTRVVWCGEARLANLGDQPISLKVTPASARQALMLSSCCTKRSCSKH